MAAGDPEIAGLSGSIDELNCQTHHSISSISVADPPQLSVVVPAYNESGRLPRTLSIIKPYLNANGLPWELILVNDGSTDSTLEVIRAEESLDPSHVRGVDLQPNGGKGPAVAAGVAESRGTLVLISDADFSTPIDELPKLRQAIEAGHDIAIGSRAKRGAQVEVSQPAHRVRSAAAQAVRAGASSPNESWRRCRSSRSGASRPRPPAGARAWPDR